MDEFQVKNEPDQLLPADPACPETQLVEQFEAMGQLLKDFESQQPVSWGAEEQETRVHEDNLAKQRLGISHGLFSALRAKHSPSASHSLRVALGISSWATSLGMEDPHLALLEISGLMHDIGKIGVPDSILTNSRRLDENDQAILERYRLHTVDILRECCLSQDVIDIVRFCGTWYDGTRGDAERSRDKLPVGARMLSIVDAYDSMTTDHVYRRAMSRDRALAELVAFSGTQFDPKLVDGFCRLIETNEVRLSKLVADRWLNQLDASQSRTFWGLGRVASPSSVESVEFLFKRQLVDSMNDGVVFVDHHRNILLWNRAMERLTGITSNSVFQKTWMPSLLDLSSVRGKVLDDCDCPVRNVVQSSVPHSDRYCVRSRSGGTVLVEFRAHPVTNVESVNYGAVIMIRDLSSEISLEEEIENLQAMATQDPLTKVANRAEFERVQQVLLHEHMQKNKPCSMIMSDLDFFKRINDDYGHQAGDEALMIFAAMLKRFRKQGDVVARYGGEEFILLCANCDGMEAEKIAESIRQTLEQTPIPVLENRCCTASFGVTEIQPGDSAETMLRRADRALMQAKEAGRNRVVHLGSGLVESDPVTKKPAGLLSWFSGKEGPPLDERWLVTTVPLVMAVEKLRGFLSDQDGQILRVDGNRVAIKVDGKSLGIQRRRGDRGLPFTVDLTFEDVAPGSEHLPPGASQGTLVHLKVHPIRSRDRRRADADEQIRGLLASFKAYFVAKEIKSGSTSPFERAATEHGKR